MKKSELINLGVPKSCCDEAITCVINMRSENINIISIREILNNTINDPESFLDHKFFYSFAQKLIEAKSAPDAYTPREEPAPYKIWGTGLDENAVDQLKVACDLPIAERAALMPDAHLGYGLPIGGVLATKNAVVPYAVGVDIACRMKMTVLDIKPEILEDEKKSEKLIAAINRETRFGVGATFEKSGRRNHPVMYEDWDVSPVTKDGINKAWEQLGTSGSGNHYIDLGTLTLDKDELSLSSGTYLAILTHSGSRGIGAKVCSYYYKLAKEKHPELPKELKDLSWLDLDSEEGNEYWNAMQLMGKYAEANHACIHYHMAKNLGCEVLADVENHHNFAWKETHGGQEVIVHRKGATPAGKGVLGIIPGSMGTPGYIVRGLGNPESLRSASHGAGRAMSRTKAKDAFNWTEVNKFLADKKITLLSAGLDEVPGAYKDIDVVMGHQVNLVTSVAKFEPRIVKMAEPGERPED